MLTYLVGWRYVCCNLFAWQWLGCVRPLISSAYGGSAWGAHVMPCAMAWPLPCCAWGAHVMPCAMAWPLPCCAWGAHVMPCAMAWLLPCRACCAHVMPFAMAWRQLFCQGNGIESVHAYEWTLFSSIDLSPTSIDERCKSPAKYILHYANQQTSRGKLKFSFGGHGHVAIGCNVYPSYTYNRTWCCRHSIPLQEAPTSLLHVKRYTSQLVQLGSKDVCVPQVV